MKIKLTTVYVSDHEQALHFYTEVPGNLVQLTQLKRWQA